MSHKLLLENILFGTKSIELYIPNPIDIKNQYQKQISIDPETPFPYWSQIWPAAIALSKFLEKQPCYIENKKVLELAAGLGLPSLVAAQVAKAVYCTDYLFDAVDAIKRSILHNQFNNMSCGLLDWNNMPNPFPQADVVLMSDINYNPTDFETIYSILSNFLKQGSTVILSTPQRLLAKPFVEQLMPWCSLKEEIEVNHLAAVVPITVMVLSKNRIISPANT